MIPVNYFFPFLFLGLLFYRRMEHGWPSVYIKALIALFGCVFGLAQAHAYEINVQPRVSAELTYTDNLFLDSGDDPQAPKEEDGYTIVSPGFTAELLSRRQGASLTYDFGYTRYFQWTSRNSWYHNMGLNGWHQFGRHTRLEVNDNLSYTADTTTDRHFEVTRPPESTLPEDYVARRDRQPYLTNYGNISLSHQFGPDDSITIEYSNGTRFDFGDTDYSDDERYGQQSDDYMRHTPRGQLVYWFDPTWGVELEGSYDYGDFDISEDTKTWTGRFRLIRRFSRTLDTYVEYSMLSIAYDDPDTPDGGENPELLHRDTRDYVTHNSVVGLAYQIADDMSVDFNAGAFIQDYEEGKTEVNFTGLLDFNKSFQHGSVTLYASAGQALGVYTSESLGPSLYFEGGVRSSYQLMEFVGLTAYFAYRRDNYDEVPARDGTPGDDGGIENNYGAGTGVEWQVMPWLSVGLSYAFHHLDSTHDIGLYDSNYTENRGMLTVTLSPERPWRWIR